MSRPMSIHRHVFVSLTLCCIAGAGWGCSVVPENNTSQSTSSGSGGAGGSQGTGGFNVDGGMNIDDAGACTSTSAAAQRVQLDIIFLIDRSASMSGPKWIGIKAGLSTFFNDPASAKISAGLSYFPNDNIAMPCVPEDYKTLDVPINVLPANAFALTNSMPADAIGGSTPTYGALKGTLMVATAYQDAHPKHKVIVVFATDGDMNQCGMYTYDDVANLAKSARNYNGVLTYVIGLDGVFIDFVRLDKLAAAGGTTAAYNITNNINQFVAKMAEIRGMALGCEFEIPPPPVGQSLDPDKVNFSYTPQGMGMPKVLLRADDLTDCAGAPGWYYDSNFAPTKILLCPASCTTVQADSDAKVSVLFGCKSQIN